MKTEKSAFKRFGEGLGRFARREPVYVLMLAVALFLYLISVVPGADKEEGPGAGGLTGKEPRAKTLLGDRDAVKRALAEDETAATAAAVVFIIMALLLFAGLILDFAVLVRRTGGRALLERSRAQPAVKWDLWDAVKIVILFFFSGYVMAVITALLSPVLPSGGGGGRIVSIVNATAMNLVGVCFVFYFALYRYGHKMKDLGLTAKNLLRNISYGFLGYLSVQPRHFATLIGTALALDILGRRPAPQPVFRIFLAEEKAPMLAYLSVFVAVAGPVMEEIFFRGFIYPAVRKAAGAWRAILISALLFSVLHAHLAGLLPIFILGAFLAYLYEKTGSLVPSITVHITHNLIMVFLIFFIKGISAAYSG